MNVDRLTIDLHSEHDSDRLGRALAAVIQPNDVIGLIGPLGAGKTRLTRGFAEALGVDPLAISSPTFVLINEYAGVLPIYHFDAYRLAGPDDFDALGATEYFRAGGVCVVEWADVVFDRLPVDCWIIRMTPLDESRRSVTIVGPNLEALRALRSRGGE